MATSYDTNADTHTVTLTVRSEFYAQAKRFGLEPSQIAEDALAREVAKRKHYHYAQMFLGV